MPRGNKALVEEADGKGYVVSMGTYVGNNGGRVTRAVIEEILRLEDIAGHFCLDHARGVGLPLIGAFEQRWQHMADPG